MVRKSLDGVTDTLQAREIIGGLPVTSTFTMLSIGRGIASSMRQHGANDKAEELDRLLEEYGFRSRENMPIHQGLRVTLVEMLSEYFMPTMNRLRCEA